MRIAFINQFYLPDLSPTAHLCASLAEHRAGLGDEVLVITGRGSYVPVATTKAAGSASNPRIERLWTPQRGKGTLIDRCLDYGIFFVLTLYRMATLPHHDVIVSLTTPPYIALAGLLHRFLHPRCRLILWNMDCYPEVAEMVGAIRPGGALSRLLHGINRLLFRQLDALICLDAAMRDRLLGTHAPDCLPVTVIPNWEATDLFPDPPAEPLPDPIGAVESPENFVVLYLGNAGQGHSFETVAAAAEELRADPVRFLFVGGGARWQWLARARQDRGLHSFLLRDYVPKERTRALMASSHCALITLRDEACGLMSPSKLHAYLAMGLPVIYIGPEGTNVDEAITRFGCGVSLRQGDIGGLVDTLRCWRGKPAVRRELARRARLAFEMAYSDRRTLPQFDAIIEMSHAPRRALP